jgi:hypothetical protein
MTCTDLTSAAGAMTLQVLLSNTIMYSFAIMIIIAGLNVATGALANAETHERHYFGDTTGDQIAVGLQETKFS